MDGTIGSAEVSALIERDLAILSESEGYTAVQLAMIAPHVGRRILELGAGTGNHTVLLADRRPELLVALENEDRFCAEIRRRCGARAQVVQGDIARLDDIADELASFKLDTVIAINVIEHIEDDIGCLDTVGRVLAPGGRIILLAPAHRLLYAELDRKYGHYRRYTRAMFAAYAERLGMRLVENRYFNMLGAVGWLLVARIGRAKQMSRRGMRLFDWLVPLQQRLERHLPVPFGLGALAVFEKRARR